MTEVKREAYLSLEELAKRRGQELQRLGMSDGSVHTLFSSGSTRIQAAMAGSTFGLRSKFPAFKGWKNGA